MPRFFYRARDEKGSLIVGSMEADTKVLVYSQLDSMGLIPVSVVEERSFLDLKEVLVRFQKVKDDDLIFFTRQLQTVIRSGIPLISGLRGLEEQTANLKLKRAIRQISQDIDRGMSLSDAISKHKDIFSELYISMVRAGEVGGVLDDVLERLAGILEFQMKTKEMLKSAMRYPLMVSLGIAVAFFVLVTFVIPRFAALFQGFKMELPLPTRMMLLINSLVQTYGPLIFPLLVLLGIVLYFYSRTPTGRLLFDRLKLKIPIIGPILLKICMSRFAYMFENMIRAGVPIMRTFEVVSKTVGNEFIAQKITEISTKIEKGRGISKPLKESGIFPTLVVHLVQTGEETGALEEMLKEVSTHYDREVTYSISRLSAWIEPIMTATLSIMILFLALAVLMPWWNMIQAVRMTGG
ncbi:MAG: type II secretion system F family protein [Desulfobacterota bacterium]|nr:type II secretion system F family protein [Thermodesulfobacteriota bacterium]MDW8001585.1 type II secretion system F family protein [Deltaproteobacteria bacterium]